MIPPPIPPNESARVQALRRLLILDTSPEERFDRITRLAQRIFGTPIALISLIDAERQWFKSRVGVNVTETSRTVSFCAHAVAADAALVVPDTHQDERFRDNPLVTGGPGLRFYAGEILRSNDGHALGTLCIADTRPRDLSPADQSILRELAAMARDELNAISEERLGELLRHSEERFNLLVGASDAGFFDTNLETGESYYSARWKNLLGYDEHELSGHHQTWLDLLHPDDHHPPPATGIPANGLVPLSRDFRMRHKHGHWVWIHAQAVQVHDRATGRVRRILGFHTDITARRELEAQMRLLDLAVRHISDGLCVTNAPLDPADVRIVYANPALIAMTGYAEDELVGQPPSLLLRGGPDADVASQIWHDAFRRGESFSAEVVNYRKDGSPFDVQWRIAPVRNERGEITHWVSVRQDITHRKQAERELTAAKEEADRANAAKSQFLANMSHEIRTPLNGVIGMAELLADTPLNEEQRDFVETILNSSDNLLTIINDVLDYSKIDFGHLELEAQPFSPADLADDVVDLLSFRATSKNLELTVLVEPDVPPAVVGDATRLRQILLNLVSNAVKFTDAGEVTLELSVTPAGPDHTRLRLCVRDTGIGIPPDRLDRLFKLFSQVDASTTRRYGGTGLGLAISQRLAQLMDSEIHVQSEVGHGTTFSLELELPVAHVAPRSTPEPDLRGCRLLVVDDNATNRRMLHLQLSAWGAACTLASGAAEAFAQVQNQPPFTLAILDMQMPGRDGLDLARDLQALPARQRPPLMLCSSVGVPLDRDFLRALGFTSFLSKPVRRSTLASAITEALAAASGPDRPSAPTPPAPAPGPLGQLRILLAEDNPVNRKVALALLAQLGCRADVAADGREAVAAVLAHPYDVVLMDVHMPELDGLDATREIIARLPPARLPRIVAVTADALRGDREKCLDAGMHDYITKPIKSDELRALLARIVAA